MNKEAELLKIIEETSGCFFHLSINAEGNWTLRIYITKVMFKGSLNEVFQQTIDEITQSRTITPTNSKLPKYQRKKYQYQSSNSLSKQSLDKEIITETKTAEHTGNYSSKLKFTKRKGFANVTDGMATLGRIGFENEFKQWLKQ
jgi:hypothetical protein